MFAHGGRILFGEWCFVGEGTRVWSASSVTIGDRVLISHGVNIHDCDSHPRDPAERHRHYRELRESGHPRTLDSVPNAPVVIGDDAWIGFNATVLKGVTIGARSIVAAGSIVTADSTFKPPPLREPGRIVDLMVSPHLPIAGLDRQVRLPADPAGQPADR